MAEDKKPKAEGWKEQVWKQIQSHVFGGDAAKAVGTKSGDAIKKLDRKKK